MDWRAAVFDLDGTLADTLQTITVALNHGLAALGLPGREEREVRRMVGEGIGVLCERALPAGRADLLARLHAEVRAFYDRNTLLHCRLYDGVEAMLRALHGAGAHLAVLSNKPDELAARTVEGLGVARYFDCVLGHREEFPRKPDPAALRWILERFDLDPRETLYVGDTPIDMQTAGAAGLAAVAVTWGFRDREELLAFAPRYVVDRPAEIVRIVLGGEARDDA